MSNELIYFHDPMCSWCWAFRPAFKVLSAQLPMDMVLRRVVGGLAPDNEQPMPEEMRDKVKGYWRAIQETVPGTDFNFTFWDKCTPKRSTYNACRAVLAAKHLSPIHENLMIEAIQRAYYLDARNPSELDTLIDLASEIGINRELFSSKITSSVIEEQLHEEIAFTRNAPVYGFPSLLVRRGPTLHPVIVDYLDPELMRIQIDSILANHASD